MRYRIVQKGSEFTPQYEASLLIFWTEWVNVQPSYSHKTYERALEAIRLDKLRNAPDPKPIIHYID